MHALHMTVCLIVTVLISACFLVVQEKTEIPSAVHRAVLSPELCPTSAFCKYPRKSKKMP